MNAASPSNLDEAGEMVQKRFSLSPEDIRAKLDSGNYVTITPPNSA